MTRLVRPLPLLLATALAFAAPTAVLAQATAVSQAPANSPSKLVLDNSTRILNTLESRRAEFTADRSKLRDFMKSEFDTVFDRDYAARLVLGTHGRGASDADVALFADALADSLMQRYGSSLLDFNTRLQVRVKSETPIRGGAIVKVSSEYVRPAGEPIPVDYLMRQSGGQWKLFDVMVEGVSFIQTFRNQFDAPLRQKSIPQVAADLRAGTLSPGAGR